MFHKAQTVLLFVVVPVLLASFFISGRAQPDTGIAQQQETSYPGPSGDTLTPYPYPGEGTPPTAVPTQTPAGTNLTPNPTQLSTLTLTPTESISPSATLRTTPRRNFFGTEDAEMKDAQVTPPPSETPQPTSTLTPTQTPSATPTVIQAFEFNRMWFVAGILIPFGLLLIVWLVRGGIKSGEFGQK
jgi:hypothetical protein